jgi:hypothetical protein
MEKFERFRDGFSVLVNVNGCDQEGRGVLEVITLGGLFTNCLGGFSPLVGCLCHFFHLWWFSGAWYFSPWFSNSG